MIINKSYSYITEFDDKDYNFTHADLLPYIWAYLEEKYKFLGENPENITEKEVDRLHCLMKKMWIVREMYIYIYINIINSNMNLFVCIRNNKYTLVCTCWKV